METAEYFYENVAHKDRSVLMIDSWNDFDLSNLNRLVEVIFSTIVHAPLPWALGSTYDLAMLVPMKKV